MDTRETEIYSTVILTAVIFGIIVFYFFLSIIRQQRRMLQIQKQNLQTEVKTMENERSRIARDIHDDIGPLLSVIKFQVDNVEASDREEEKQLQKASSHIDYLIDRMRSIANNLMPSVLERKGLIDAIEEYIDSMQEAVAVRISFLHAIDSQIKREQAINIYRIVQEAVHNCIKHANAKKLDIRLEEQEGILMLLLEDDGVGFDYEKAKKQKSGLGLGSLASRTQIMGGSIKIESKPGKGSKLYFEIPVL